MNNMHSIVHDYHDTDLDYDYDNDNENEYVHVHDHDNDTKNGSGMCRDTNMIIVMTARLLMRFLMIR